MCYLFKRFSFILWYLFCIKANKHLLKLPFFQKIEQQADPYFSATISAFPPLTSTKDYCSFDVVLGVLAAAAAIVSGFLVELAGAAEAGCFLEGEAEGAEAVFLTCPPNWGFP